MGLLEWQFSLPTSRLRQFSTKLSAAYLLSLLLGALLPWLLNGLVWSYSKHDQAFLGDFGFEGSALLLLAAFAGLMTTFGLYASSLRLPAGAAVEALPRPLRGAQTPGWA